MRISGSFKTGKGSYHAVCATVVNGMPCDCSCWFDGETWRHVDVMTEALSSHAVTPFAVDMSRLFGVRS